MTYFCIFDGKELVSVPDYDVFRCPICGMDYSGPFLEQWEQERNARGRSKSEHPTLPPGA